MKNFRADADKNPLYHVAVVWLLAVGFAALPLKNFFLLFIGDDTLALYFSGITVRALLSAAAVYLIFAYGFLGLIKTRVSGKGIILCVPALIVAVNNFPIIAALTGDVVFYGDTLYSVLFVINCLFIGAFEELTFRGIIFPLIFIKLKSKKRAAFYAAAASSAIFALTHVVNLLAGASFGSTVLQVGYSFLIGGLCALSVLKTGSVVPAVIIHFVYDLGGLVLAPWCGLAQGFQWNALTVIITAVIGVLVAVFEIIYALKSDGNALRLSCYIGEKEKGATS